MKTEKHHKQLTYEDRIRIEALYRAKHSKREIADMLKVHISTIYREIDRGLFKRLDGHSWIYSEEYSADVAQKDYKEKQTSKGAPLKIGNDHNLVKYIEYMIGEKKYSPDAVIGSIKTKQLYFKADICTKTLYNYINGDLFLNITKSNLPMRGLKTRKYRKVKRLHVKMPHEKSIDQRPTEANERQYGHWEMDTVVGKKSSKACLLVLTERKTRHEIIMKLKNHSQEEVKKALDKIERHYGKAFSKIFKTITCDNGTEFLNVDYIEKSCLNKRKRTMLYYCHPYSSFERGSNERANGIIRRFIPKGTEIEKVSNKQIADIQTWINEYPRKILGYRNSNELFTQEVKTLG